MIRKSVIIIIIALLCLMAVRCRMVFLPNQEELIAEETKELIVVGFSQLDRKSVV